MMKQVYIVQDGQSLFDVSMELFGHQDGAFDLLDENVELNLDALYPGQKIYYTPAIINKKVKEEVMKKGVVFATSSTMNDSPVPPEAPEGNVVFIHLYGGTTIDITAPGEYTVLPATVVDANDNVIETLGPNDSYMIHKAKVKNTAGFTIFSMMPGDEEVLPNNKIIVKVGGEVVAMEELPYGDDYHVTITI